jgi:hypothetical protein
MNLPFSAVQFFDLFRDYNLAIFPVHFAGYLLGFTALWFLLPERFSWKVVAIILGVYWLWIGIAYHFVFFTRINPAAGIFGSLFVVQGVLFLISAFRHNNFSLAALSSIQGIAGWGSILYGMIIYSSIGYLLGHRWPFAPLFGVAPCPTTIFTLGIMSLMLNLKRWLLIIPVIWSLIGFTAAIKLGVTEDIGLLVAGLLTVIFQYIGKPKPSLVSGNK